MVKLNWLILAVLLCVNILEMHGSWLTETNVDAENEDVALHRFTLLAHKIIQEPFMRHEQYLLRWLRAHEFDVEKTQLSLKKAIEWRKTNNMSTILDENFTASMHHDAPYTLDDNVDKQGHPMLQISQGRFNMRKIVLAGQLQQNIFVRYIIQSIEMAEMYLHYKRTIEGHENLTQTISIVDGQGFNLATTACLRCMMLSRDIVPILDDYYPGLLYRLYFINTPKIFEASLAMIKSFMSEETRNAIRVYDADTTKWRAGLLEDIPEEQLPIKYGGLSQPRTEFYVQKLLRDFLDSERSESDSNLDSTNSTSSGELMKAGVQARKIAINTSSSVSFLPVAIFLGLVISRILICT